MPIFLPTVEWEHRYQQRLALAPLTSAATSLRLVTEIGLALDAPILDVGCGTSAFLSGLLALHYANLLATDISPTALSQHRHQLGVKEADRILWLAEDVTTPHQLAALQPVLLWHDQGLLQELTMPAQQQAYTQLLDHVLAPGGWVLLAAPTPVADGPAPSKLPQAYDATDLATLLGAEYVLQHHEQQPYARLTEPTRLYTYALFQRTQRPSKGFRLQPFGPR
ncbi:MAG: methyltransferase [Janthinobacterium lividum]